MDLQSADVRGAASCGASQQAARVQTAILLGLLLAVQFGAAVLNPLGANESDAYAEQLFLAALGAALAWPPLLAVWAVFGPQRAAVRLPLTVWLAVAITLAGIYGLNRNLGRPGVEMLIFNAAWLFAFGVLLGPLWLIRVLRRWRLERPEPGADAPACQAAKSNSQFSLRAILGWTFAAALLLGAYGAVAPVARLELELEMIEALLLEAGLIGFFVALGGLQVVALAWIVLADGRRVLLRIILSVLLVTGISGAGVVFQRLVNGLSVGEIASVVAGAMFNGLLSLGVVRTCGYQLRRSPKKATAAEAAATAAAAGPISRLRFAFALSSLAAIATGLICTVPHRQEMWRRAEILSDWNRCGVRVSYDDQGRIISAQCREPIADEVCQRLTTLFHLRQLSLNGSSIDDRQLVLLAPLSGLDSLDLSNTAITDRGLKQLGHFTKLNALNLSNTRVTDAGLKDLPALPLLQNLQLSLTDISDEGLSALERLNSLASVNARLTAATAAGAEKLRQRNPRVSVEFGASDALLTGWQTNTRTVTATAPSGVQTIGIGRESVKVKRLHARGKAVTNGVTAGVTDAGLITLAVVQTDLEELDLRDSEVTDQGILQLKTLKSLKRLDLRGAPVTEQGVQRLARVLPECEILR